MTLFFSVSAFAQSGWFRIHDLPDIDEEQVSVICERGNNFYVLVTGLNNSIPYTRNAVLKLDKEGEIIWQRFIEYPAITHADFDFHYPKMLLVSKDTCIYVLSYALNDFLQMEFLLNKFSADGGLIWVKTYGFADTEVLGEGYGLTLATDSLGLVMTGKSRLPYPNNKYAIFRIDSSGSVLWKKLLSVSSNSVGESVPVVQMPNGEIKIAFDDNLLTDYHDYLYGLDSVGNIDYSYADPFTGRAHDLKLHPNGNLVYLSNERNPPMFEHGGLRIQMLTPDFDTVWSHLFYDTQFPYLFLESSFVRNLSISPDGKILALGYNVNNCILLCYDPDGTLLWKREVALEGFDQLKFNYVTWASDGGILLDGFIYGEDENNQYYEKTFFLKLDDVGCLQPDCQQTIITDAREIAQVQGDFDISPNPSQGEIEIRYKGTDLHLLENAQVSVHDANGKLVFQGKFAMNKPQLSLNLPAAGIYMVSINDWNGVLSSSKLLQSGKILIVH